MTSGRERLPGTGDRLWPALGYAAVALLVGASLADGPDLVDLVAVAAGLLVLGATTVVYLRPAVELDEETLRLRRMLSTVELPLAAVERAVVTRFLAVVVGDRRYVSTTVDRPLRAVLGRRRGERGGAPASGAATRAPTEADLVESRIARAAEDARRRHGVALLSEEQLALAAGVRRAWSWWAISVLAVPSALLAASLLLL